MTTGRPTDYTDEIATKFCEYVATNAISIKRICAKYDDIPAKTTISRWLAEKEIFRGQYLAAKEIQALLITDDLWDGIDECPAINEELALYDRKFRFHQWHLSKLAPKQFGDKKDKEDDSKKSDETIKNLSNAVSALAAKHEKDY